MAQNATDPPKQSTSIYNTSSFVSSTSTPPQQTTVSLPTHCSADFCLIPMGTSSPSVAPYIAAVQSLLSQFSTTKGSKVEGMKVSLAGSTHPPAPSAGNADPPSASQLGAADLSTQTKSGEDLSTQTAQDTATQTTDPSADDAPPRITYAMHSAGTTVSGSWTDVMEAIGTCHSLVHEMGVVRINTDIRVGTRTDKVQEPAEKVRSVEQILAGVGRDVEREGLI